MNKKFLFAIMAIAAGLVFGSCASEEEQTEEVVEVPVVEEIDTVAVDTTIEEPVVEEVAAPAPKKAAKKAQVKEEEPAVAVEAAPSKKGVTFEANTKRGDIKVTTNDDKPEKKGLKVDAATKSGDAKISIKK